VVLEEEHAGDVVVEVEEHVVLVEEEEEDETQETKRNRLTNHPPTRNILLRKNRTMPKRKFDQRVPLARVEEDAEGDHPDVDAHRKDVDGLRKDGVVPVEEVVAEAAEKVAEDGIPRRIVDRIAQCQMRRTKKSIRRVLIQRTTLRMRIQKRQQLRSKQQVRTNPHPRLRRSILRTMMIHRRSPQHSYHCRRLHVPLVDAEVFQ
jgi:hypothetical protein